MLAVVGVWHVDTGMCVVYDGYTKAEACIADEALDRKSACEVGRNYAKFELTVVDNGENVE